ncbi:MAG: SIS domain-containing protein [Tabrizicola sp.]|nr:SIS domain-containing protein [Tabrizicola sp.]
MTALPPDAGQHMSREIAEAPAVFAASVAQSVTLPDLTQLRAIYTVARGSSDAAANILSYEIMRETGLPVTSLPPSIFSLGRGVRLTDAAVLVVSQSGASPDLVGSARGAREAGATVLALTNAPGSPVEAEAHATLSIGAGPELAMPPPTPPVRKPPPQPSPRCTAATCRRRKRSSPPSCAPHTSMSSGATPALARRRNWR